MKKTFSTVALLLILVIPLATMFIGIKEVGASSSYDSEAAVNYAETWWSGRNPAYNDYGDYDCANFVSQCLIAGGLNLGICPYVDAWGCIPSCDNLHQYLVNYLGAQHEVRRRGEAEPQWFSKGDPAIFGDDSDNWRHAVFAVAEDESDYMLCNAHSQNVYHITISSFFEANPDFTLCNYYHISAQEPLELTLRALPNPTRDIDGATISAYVTSDGEPVEGAYVEFSFEPEGTPHNGFDDDDNRDTPPVAEISGTTNQLGEFQAHWGYYDVCIVSEQVITFYATASKEGHTSASDSCTLNVLPLNEAPYSEPLYGQVTMTFPSGPHNVYVSLSPATGTITSGETVYFEILIGREFDYESILELDWDAIWMVPVFKNTAGYLSEANTVTVSLPHTQEVQAEIVEDEIIVEADCGLQSDNWIRISSVDDMDNLISAVEWLDRLNAFSKGDWIGFGLGEIPDVIQTLATALYGEELGHGPEGESFDPNNENVALNVTAFGVGVVGVDGFRIRLPVKFLGEGQVDVNFHVAFAFVNHNQYVLNYAGAQFDPLSFTVRRAGRSGGPDSFGYTFIDSNKLGGPSYDWIEISGTGTEILPSSDDSWVGNINIGFFFNYYGTDYSQLAIGNNGLLFSGVGTSQYVNQPITQTPSIHGLIAPFWDDIVTWGSAGAIYYETQGTAPNRKFIVEWYDNQHYYSSTSGITFEAILYEGTNNILFQYQDVDFGSVSGSTSQDLPPYNNGGSATVGIEDTTGNIGLQYSFNEQAINLGLAILFKFPAFAGTNMYLSMNAPASMDRGNTMTYTFYYNDFGDVAASNVVLQATLSPNVDFVSASDSGTYDPTTRTVTWSIGTVSAFPSGRGSRTITVTIPSSVPVGTVIQTTASISTSTYPETRYDDNTASAQTTVTGSNLPPNVSVGPTVGTVGGVPSVYWHTPITFTYYDSAAISVDIRIHINDGGSDITGSMSGGPPTWTYSVTFYPRTGHATVTYTVHYPTTDSQVNFNIYVDPAGYVYNVVTLQRISGASVWLQRPDGQGGWENVPTGQTPAIMQPDVNPQITGADGQYQWDVLEGSYRVHVEAPGYYPADSIVVIVPPPVTDLHVGLTPLPPPPDSIPPTTTLTIGNPKYTDASGNVYVISATPLTLTAEDNIDGTGVATTGYQIYNASYDSGWITSTPPIEFYLTGLADGEYFIDYNSTDNVSNVEVPQTQEVTLDNTPPSTTLAIGQPNYVDVSGNVYVSSATLFTLTATDNPGGTGVASTSYRIYNATYDSGWLGYSASFYLTGLSHGAYSIDYYSTDNIGNIEPTNTATVILDTTPPTTTLTIGEPKYVSDTTYVTPDTPFTLEATDTGSGIFSIAYRIHNGAFDSGWQTYTTPFKLTSLADGTYTIEYNSTDNVKNVEALHTATFILFHWNYIYQDTYGRGTTLKINLAYKFFQFITPDKDYGIRTATYMKQCGRAIIISHCDKELRLITVSVDTKIDFCYAMAWDLQTRKCYLLIDKAGIE